MLLFGEHDVNIVKSSNKLTTTPSLHLNISGGADDDDAGIKTLCIPHEFDSN